MLFPVTRTTAVREDANQDGRTILGSSVHTGSLTASAAYVRHTACSRLDCFSGFETAKRFRRFCSCVSGQFWSEELEEVRYNQQLDEEEQGRIECPSAELAVLEPAPDQAAFSDISDSVSGNKDSQVHLPL